MKKRYFAIFLSAVLFMSGICTTYANKWSVAEKQRISQNTHYFCGEYYFSLENKDENGKYTLKYSKDGVNFEEVVGVRTAVYPRYNNNLYFVIDNSMDEVPRQMRFVGFNNKPAYILDNKLNVIKTINDNAYISYKGYFNGFHYIDLTYYVSNTEQNNWQSKETGPLYKTANGIDLVEVNVGVEDLSFIGGIELYDDGIIKNSYDTSNKISTDLLINRNRFNILRERENFIGYSYASNVIPLLTQSYKVGEEIVDWIDGRKMVNSVTKKYLTMDGIYGVEMPEDIGEYCFEKDNRFYFEKDEEQYYCIDKSQLTDKIKIVYQGKILAFDTEPQSEDGRVLVPMRFLLEQMGADVDWDNDTQTATVKKGDDIVSFTIDDEIAVVNNSRKAMDVPAQLINNKTMIPLRFLSEELGFNVDWDGERNMVIITE